MRRIAFLIVAAQKRPAGPASTATIMETTRLNRAERTMPARDDTSTGTGPIMTLPI
jgi:hypothetical protein